MLCRKMIRFRCIYCGQKVRAADDALGRKGKCPRCGHTIYIRPLGAKSANAAANLTDAEIAERYLKPVADASKPQWVKDAIRFAAPEHQDTVRIPRWFRRAFLPSYNRLSLFLISISMLMVLVASDECRRALFRVLIGRVPKGMPWIFILANPMIWLLLVLLGGAALCVCRLFTARWQSNPVKWLMLWFAVLVNVFTGIYAGQYMLRQIEDPRAYYLYIFPVWNIVNSVVLFALFRYGQVTPKDVSDEDVSILQAVMGTLIAVIVFVLCHYVFKWYWAITYSVCVVYATGFSHAIQQVLFPVERDLEPSIPGGVDRPPLKS